MTPSVILFINQKITMHTCKSKMNFARPTCIVNVRLILHNPSKFIKIFFMDIVKTGIK